MKNKAILTMAIAVATVLGSCTDDIEMNYPPTYDLSDIPAVEGVHDNVKAPLYWSVYEYCMMEQAKGVSNNDMDLTSAQWDNIIDWVSTDLKPYGYNMVCTDGFIPMLANDETGYMTHYGSVALKDLVAKCAAKGLQLGVYDNPLWIHGPRETKIEGTDYTFGDLYYNKETDKDVWYPSNNDTWFHWVVASHPGAQEYIDGFFKHYSEMGVKFIRMDFLSWYEDGKDRSMGIVGHGYGRKDYALAMYYIATAAKKYGVFTSLVMPHMYNDAEVEAQYGNMVRIVADTGNGGWSHCSSANKGQSFTTWPNCNNMFDGFTYWSHIAGRNKVILDGDFIRLNTFDTDNERQTVVSLQLMAGGPVTVSDQPSTIGNNLKFYTNSEMLELNKDGFVGKPVTDNLIDKNNEIWYGQMSNGDYVIGLFNRDAVTSTRSVDFSTLGISGEWNVRDLWEHADEGKASSITVNIPAHGCKVVRLTK